MKTDRKKFEEMLKAIKKYNGKKCTSNFVLYNFPDSFNKKYFWGDENADNWEVVTYFKDYQRNNVCSVTTTVIKYYGYYLGIRGIYDLFCKFAGSEETQDIIDECYVNIEVFEVIPKQVMVTKYVKKEDK